MKYIIDFKNEVTNEAINQYMSSIGATVEKTYSSFEKTFLVEVASTPVKTDIIEHIVADDDNPLQLLQIIVSDQNYGKPIIDDRSVTISNDPQNWWKTFVLYEANFDVDSYQVTRRGGNATVYVLDSGINLSHPDFVGADVSNLWTFNNNFDDNTGHGTAIASVIVGNSCGITSAKVKSVKIFDYGFQIRQSELLSALDAIVIDAATNGTMFSILNCSWIIPKNEFIENRFRDLIKSGIYIVAAAGNNGSPIADVTPASMPEVITIGSYNSELTPCNFSAYTSDISITNDTVNSGALDGWAPGSNIKVALRNGGYGMAGGTSMSAGIHSAVLAYNLSYNQVPREDRSYYQQMSDVSLSRVDMLDLTDPKYSNSVNKISTIVDKIEGSEFKFSSTVFGVSGKFMFYNFFNPRSVETIELIDPLPNQYTISPTGSFYGTCEIIQTEDLYVKNEIRYKMTLTDGKVLEDKLIIIVARDDLDPTQPTGDPLLDVRLQYCNLAPCEGIDNCTDNCGGPIGCTIVPDKNCGGPLYSRCFCNY